MSPFRRRRFGELIERQLDLWAEENAALLREVDEAERAYDRAPRDEAEERYGDYVDVVETATESLADLRDHYGATMDESEQYEREFNRSVLKRWPPLALEIENR